MIFFACRSDGSSLGEFSEEEFQAKTIAGELRPEDYYWHEGMTDWKPVAQFRVLARTQRISVMPPMRSTMKIDMNVATPADEQPASAGSHNPIVRLLRRITGKR